MNWKRLEQIDVLIYVPIEKQDFCTNEETHLAELRYAVDDILQDWLPDFNMKMIEVAGDVKTRREQVLAMIR
ncbi:hypothetical protein WJU16_08180 [Chitinophaga pollutisoli]|uniref:Uncharacterized protein n=1 Tax=Chitinophaga pollutisoli TaxID=3133966 RepID=A0ABZ2YUS2_9BACT